MPTATAAPLMLARDVVRRVIESGRAGVDRVVPAGEIPLRASEGDRYPRYPNW